MKWNGVEQLLMRFYCLDLQIIDGMKHDRIHFIQFHSNLYFLFHPIWGVYDGMRHF